MLVSATRSALCRALRRNAGALPLTDRSRHLHHQPYPQAPRAQGRDSAAAASHGADPGRVRAARAPPPASPALPVPQPRPTCSARVPSVTRSSPVKSRSPFFEGCRPQAQEIFGRQKNIQPQICGPDGPECCDVWPFWRPRRSGPRQAAPWGPMTAARPRCETARRACGCAVAGTCSRSCATCCRTSRSAAAIRSSSQVQTVPGCHACS